MWLIREPWHRFSSLRVVIDRLPESRLHRAEPGTTAT